MRSMTGYGQARVDHQGERYEARAKSVNHRYLKIDLRLSPDLRFGEPWIETLCREKISRGTVEVDLRRKPVAGVRLARIDEKAIEEYHRRLSRTARRLGAGEGLPLAALLTLPGVLQMGEEEVDLEKARPTIERVVSAALDDLSAMRDREGARLAKHLLDGTRRIRKSLDKVERLAPTVPPKYAERLRERFAALLNGSANPVEPDALAREVAIFAERCDITEEIQRLHSHLDEFARLCREKGELGKKLDYLAQEMSRETNTMGAKANDAELARHVIEMKAEVERLREQVQNVE